MGFKKRTRPLKARRTYLQRDLRRAKHLEGEVKNMKTSEIIEMFVKELSVLMNNSPVAEVLRTEVNKRLPIGWDAPQPQLEKEKELTK